MNEKPALSAFMLLIGTMMLMVGCNTQNSARRHVQMPVKVVAVLDSEFVEYHMIVVHDPGGVESFLLSIREPAESVGDQLGALESLSVGSVYAVDLVELDSRVVAHRIHNPRIQGEQPQYFTLSDSTLENMTWVWDHDTIRVPVFVSPDIYDRYYRRKFHAGN